ncbi:MAG: hypothetical protein OXG97_18350 [Candidatus Poribacteria bacterium]|nr:hypothetical protein [Candidatus Poribacteria bacterium]
MKTILVLSILFCTIASPLRAETATSTLETDIAVMKTDIRNLNGKIDNLEKNLNEKIDNLEKNFDKRFENIDRRFESLEKNVNTRFESLEKNFDRLNNIIIACIGIPLAILAIGATVWGILAYRRSRKEDTLEKQIETLTQEIETLKQRQIVSP